MKLFNRGIMASLHGNPAPSVDMDHLVQRYVKETKQHGGIGHFIVPSTNTLDAQYHLIYQQELRYSPSDYRCFDAVIHDLAHQHLTESLAKDNIAMLRNIIFGYVVNPPGKKTLPTSETLHYLTQTALLAGLAIKTEYVSSDALHRYGVGAALLYRHITDTLAHTSPSPEKTWKWLSPSRSSICVLPLIRDTCLAPYLLRDDTADADHITQDYHEEHVAQRQEAFTHAMKHAELGALAGLAHSEEEKPKHHFNRVEDLRVEVQEEAIAIARDILDKLRLQFADMTLEALMDMGDMPLVKQLLTGVSKVASTFRQHLDIALRLDPDMADDDAVLEASMAIGIFDFHGKMQESEQARMQAMVAEQTGNISLAGQLHQQAKQLHEEAVALPGAWKQTADRSITSLLDSIEKGMDRIVSRVQEMQGGLGAVSERDLGQADAQDMQQEQPQEHLPQSQQQSANKSDKKHQQLYQADQIADMIRAARMKKSQMRDKLQDQREAKAASGQDKKGDPSGSGGSRQKQAGKSSSTISPEASETAKAAKALGANLLDAATLKAFQSSMDVGGMEMSEELMPNSPQRTINSIKNNKQGNISKTAAVRSDVLRDQQQVEEQTDQQQALSAKKKNTQFSR